MSRLTHDLVKAAVSSLAGSVARQIVRSSAAREKASTDAPAPTVASRTAAARTSTRAPRGGKQRYSATDLPAVGETVLTSKGPREVVAIERSAERTPAVRVKDESGRESVWTPGALRKGSAADIVQAELVSPSLVKPPIQQIPRVVEQAVSSASTRDLLRSIGSQVRERPEKGPRLLRALWRATAPVREEESRHPKVIAQRIWESIGNIRSVLRVAATPAIERVRSSVPSPASVITPQSRAIPATTTTQPGATRMSRAIPSAATPAPIPALTARLPTVQSVIATAAGSSPQSGTTASTRETVAGRSPMSETVAGRPRLPTVQSVVSEWIQRQTATRRPQRPRREPQTSAVGRILRRGIQYVASSRIGRAARRAGGRLGARVAARVVRPAMARIAASGAGRRVASIAGATTRALAGTRAGTFVAGTGRMVGSVLARGAAGLGLTTAAATAAGAGGAAATGGAVAGGAGAGAAAAGAGGGLAALVAAGSWVPIIGQVTLVLTSLGLAATAVVKALHGAAARMVESQQHLSRYNAAIAFAAAKLEIGRIGRDFRLGAMTGASFADLTQSLNKIENTLLPYRALLTDILNTGLARLVDVVNLLIKVFELSSPIVAGGLAWERGKRKTELVPYVQLMQDIIDGKVGGPRAPRRL